MDKIPFNKTFKVANDLFAKGFDDELQIVFGIANTSVAKDGSLVTDSQDDQIEPRDLEAAAYAFNLCFRKAGVNHQGGAIGTLVESFFCNAEKMAALAKGLGVEMPFIKHECWWVGFLVEDENVWKQVKSGELSDFSIQGVAERVAA